MILRKKADLLFVHFISRKFKHIMAPQNYVNTINIKTKSLKVRRQTIGKHYNCLNF